MELGLCAPVDKAQEAREAGFDYLECPLVSLPADEDDAAFAPVRERYMSAGLPVRAFNLFLPSTHKVTGPEVDWHGLQRYTERALKRAAEVGASRAVFGSGGARNVPEGFPPDEALEQLVRFLRYAGDVAAEAGIVIAIEPLRRQETNLINTVADGVKLAERVERSAVRVLADFYHMAEEQEPLKHLVDYRDWLEHVHVADTGRHAPGTGSYPYQQFAALLSQAEYRGRVSVECRWRDFAAEAPASVQFLRGLFGQGKWPQRVR